MSLDWPKSDEELRRLASARTVQEQGARSDTASSAQQPVPINTKLVRKSSRATSRIAKPSEHALKIKMAIAQAKQRASEFRTLCREKGLPLPTVEHQFHEDRAWRFDFAWTEEKIALECDGGLFVQGGHNRGAQIVKTHEKLNAAAIRGWRVLYCVPDKLKTDATIELLKQAMEIIVRVK